MIRLEQIPRVRSTQGQSDGETYDAQEEPGQERITRREALARICSSGLASLKEQIIWAAWGAGAVLFPLAGTQPYDLAEVRLVEKNVMRGEYDVPRHEFTIEFKGKRYIVVVSKDQYRRYTVGASGYIMCSPNCTDVEKNFVTDFREADRAREAALQEKLTRRAQR